MTYGSLVCCLDSLTESKQKCDFLTVFSVSGKAGGHYFALLDILLSSQYLISQAAISNNGVRVCACVCVEVFFVRTFIILTHSCHCVSTYSAAASLRCHRGAFS